MRNKLMYKTKTKFRFEFKEDSHYVKYWVIQKQFLWFFWRDYKKIPYRLLEDGYPNINQVMDYVDWLNLTGFNNNYISTLVISK